MPIACILVLCPKGWGLIESEHIMASHITHADITVTRLFPSGALELSAMHPDGYYVSQRYQGYTTREARRIFHGYANGIQA